MLELAIRCEMFNVFFSYPLTTHNRLWAGVDTDVDVQQGAKLIRRVYEGPFLPEKKGVAASLVCYLFVNCDDPQAGSWWGMSGAFRHWVAALHFAAQSCRLGHFSFACNFVAETSLTIGTQFQPTYDQGLQEDLDLVLAHRQTFQEETGYQPHKPQLCARCLTMKPKESLLLCAGSCARIRKPQYCGKECQNVASSFLFSLTCSAFHGFFFLPLQDWKKHRKWCKKDLDLTASSEAVEVMLYGMHLTNDSSWQSRERNFCTSITFYFPFQTDHEEISFLLLM